VEHPVDEDEMPGIKTPKHNYSLRETIFSDTPSLCPALRSLKYDSRRLIKELD